MRRVCSQGIPQAVLSGVLWCTADLQKDELHSAQQLHITIPTAFQHKILHAHLASSWSSQCPSLCQLQNYRQGDIQTSSMPCDTHLFQHACRDDITIARSAQGKKMRIGEGGTGTVYKALMHSCDEVAVKVVRTAQPTLQEASEFHKVRALLAVRGCCGCSAWGPGVSDQLDFRACEYWPQ